MKILSTSKILNGTSLFDILHLLPLSLEVLLPQADFVVPPTDSKNVSARTPAHPPQDAVELELLASPLAGVRRVGGPNTDGFVLRRRRDVGLGEDARGPGDITDPVGVAFQCLSGVVGLGFMAESVREAER